MVFPCLYKEGGLIAHPQKQPYSRNKLKKKKDPTGPFHRGTAGGAPHTVLAVSFSAVSAAQSGIAQSMAGPQAQNVTVLRQDPNLEEMLASAALGYRWSSRQRAGSSFAANP